MRTVTKEFKVYTLEEVREKALDMNRFINVGEGDDWWEYTLDEWKERLAEKGFKNAKIYFSGFYSQGDGACFDCKDFDMKKLLGLVSLPEVVKDYILRCIEDESFYLEINQANCANYYYHENTRYLSWSSDIEYAGFYRDGKYFERIVDDFVSQLERIREDLCKEIYKDLREEYEGLISDEAVEDTLLANEYEFNADGTIF